MLQQMFNPDLYHGRMGMKNFFEGWYFKLVDKRARNAFALIPGVFWGKQKRDHHSFLHILDGRYAGYEYVSLPTKCFSAASPLKIILDQIGSFSLKQISLAVQGNEQNVAAAVQFHQRKPWPSRLWSPGSMGPYNFLPGMQCYSQVCLMDAELSGCVQINGRRINMDGGRGYVEKNWGRAFPHSWIWIQSNNFLGEDAALSCSIGHIPLLSTSFRGFLIGLYVQGTFYEFTTMNRSKMKIISLAPDIELEVTNKQYTLSLITKSRPESFILCRGPRNGQMVPLVEESLKGRLDAALYERSSGRRVWHDTAKAVGLEYGGDQMQVIDELQASPREVAAAELVPPEAGREQQKQGEDFQPTQEHQERQEDFADRTKE